MKFLLSLAILLGALVQAHAGIGGSGGGPAPASKMVTVEVCDSGESGTLCRQVTYHLRPPSEHQSAACTIAFGEAHERPCPENFSIPGWLKALDFDGK